MSKVRVITFQILIEFLNEERIILIWMSFQQVDLYFLNSVLIDGGKDSINVGFINEALKDAKLFICDNLMMN